MYHKILIKIKFTQQIKKNYDLVNFFMILNKECHSYLNALKQTYKRVDLNKKCRFKTPFVSGKTICI